MKSGTEKQKMGWLGGWFGNGTVITRASTGRAGPPWCVRRTTSNYLLIVPNPEAGNNPINEDGERRYALIRWDDIT